MMETKAAARIVIRGRVQGVGYRYFAQERAQALRLAGWVRNLPSGDVESYAEGSRDDIEQWIAQLKKGPSLSLVDHIDINWSVASQNLSSFSIR